MNLKIKSITAATVASITCTVLTGQVNAQEVAPKEQAAVKLLDIGSDAPAIEGATWIQGNEVKSLNEKGKLYIIECWATWCRPCIQIIPHMNDLHKKYADKGLNIIGMNVWEEGIEKAQNFVKKQGKNMSYTVAYSGGKKSAFSSAWLDASKTNSIPTAFAVRGGKIIYKGHPSRLNNKTIEKMLATDFNAAKFAKEQAEEEAKTKAFSMKANELYKSKNWAELKNFAANDDFSKNTETAARLISDANTKLKDWDAQTLLLKEIMDAKYGSDIKATEILGYSFTSLEANDKTKALAKQLEPLYPKEGLPDKKNYFGGVAYARILFLSDKNKAATEQLESIKLEVTKLKGKRRGVKEFIAKLDKYLAGLKDGKFPPF